jgi:hypothetical protein
LSGKWRTDLSAYPLNKTGRRLLLSRRPFFRVAARMIAVVRR